MGSPFKLGRPTSRARELRNEATDAERVLWQRLKSTQLAGLKFSRQIPIAGYSGDFVCRSHKLLIELDGSQHQDQVTYDTKRTATIDALGYRVIRFWNGDVFDNMPGVLDTILEAANNREGAPTPLTPSRVREGE